MKLPANLPFVKTVCVATLAAIVVAFFKVPSEKFGMASLFIIAVAGLVIYFGRAQRSYRKQMKSLEKMSGGSKSTGSYGSADFARSSDIKKAVLVRNLLCSRSFDSRWADILTSVTSIRQKCLSLSLNALTIIF